MKLLKTRRELFSKVLKYPEIETPVVIHYAVNPDSAHDILLLTGQTVLETLEIILERLDKLEKSHE